MIDTPMNFLAHSALAFDDPALVAGQFAGDFVRGTDLSAFPPRVAAGIRLHRRVDAFTDAHPSVAAARTAFAPELRRHAGIIVDVVFDHLLARDWPGAGGRTLVAHARWTDAALAAHAPSLPPSLRRFAAFARRTRLLEGNARVGAVGETLERLARRSPRMRPLSLAAARAESLVAPLEAPFACLWPALADMAASRLAELEAEEPAAGSATAGGPASPIGARTTKGRES